MILTQRTGQLLKSVLSAVVLGASVLPVACHPRMDRAKADRLAAARVQQYAKDERLNAERFTKPEVREQQGKWLYIYEYVDPPKQSVAVIVFVDGHVEVSRMLEIVADMLSVAFFFILDALRGNTAD